MGRIAAFLYGAIAYAIFLFTVGFVTNQKQLARENIESKVA